MGKRIGYKQSQDYFNTTPIITDKIYDLSTICETRFDPTKKAKTVSDLLQIPPKYYFSLNTKEKTASTLFKHCCYYDNLNDAKKAHKTFKLKLYDQETAPYLKKISNKRKLTLEDKDKILGIFDHIDNLGR